MNQLLSSATTQFSNDESAVRPDREHGPAIGISASGGSQSGTVLPQGSSEDDPEDEVRLNGLQEAFLQEAWGLGTGTIHQENMSDDGDLDLMNLEVNDLVADIAAQICSVSFLLTKLSRSCQTAVKRPTGGRPHLRLPQATHTLSYPRPVSQVTKLPARHRALSRRQDATAPLPRPRSRTIRLSD